MKAVRILCLLGILLGIAVLGGCSTVSRWFSGGYRQKPTPPPAPKQAQLVHQRDVARRQLALATDGIGLLGDIGGLRSMRFRAQPYTALTQHSFAEEGGDFDPQISPDGQRILFASTAQNRNPDVFVKGVRGNTVTQLTDDPAADVQPAFSPDGRMIAFASNRAGNWDLYVMDADGRNVVQVTRGTEHELHPTFAPDGKRLAYCSYSARQDRWELWVVNLTNTAERSLIGFGLFPVWSPQKDKDVIAFQRARQRGSRWFGIWTCQLVSNEARNLTEIVSSTDWAAVGPAFSLDGTRIAFTTVNRSAVQRGGTEVRGEDVWLVGIDGFGRMQLTGSADADWAPTWGTDGRVYFCSDRGGKPNVWSVEPMQMPLPAGNARLTQMGPGGRPAAPVAGSAVAITPPQAAAATPRAGP
jgi:TolB protein